MSLLKAFNFGVGLYLLFGALGESSNGCHTPETELTAAATIDFVAGHMDDGVPIGCILPGVSMILPGTRDARRYEGSAAHATKPLRFDICHEGPPWASFEGGLGMHAPGVSADLLERIREYGQARLGAVWPGEAVV